MRYSSDAQIDAVEKAMDLWYAKHFAESPAVRLQAADDFNKQMKAIKHWLPDPVISISHNIENMLESINGKK